MAAFGYASCSLATQPERIVSFTMLSPTAMIRNAPPAVRMRRVRCSGAQSGVGVRNWPAGISAWMAAICASDRSGVRNR